jgi:hypothetical protein
MAITDAQLRAKIRDLMTSGDLPNERPRVHQVGYGPPEIAPRSDVCLICGDPGPPPVTYVWSGRRAANLHAACDAIWKQERERT